MPNGTYGGVLCELPFYENIRIRCERSVNMKVGDKHLRLVFTSYSIFGLSFSLQNHINLLFIQHFPCRYAFISKTLRNFAVVNISII